MPANCRAAASLLCRDCRRYGARRATRTISSAHDVRAFFSLSIGSDPFCASSVGTPSMATAQGGLRPRGRLRLPHGFVRSSERSLLFTSKANISPVASSRLDLDLRPERACALADAELCVQPARNWVPIRQIAIGTFGAELDKAWSLRERRLACPTPKAKSQRSNPRFRPAQVSQRCCHARIHYRRPEGGSRPAARDSRELRLGPMRPGHLCPL